MERGSSKHSPRQDEALAEAVQGELGPHGSNREEWHAAEPPADDDPPDRLDGSEAGGPNVPPTEEHDDAELSRLQHDLKIANDFNPDDDET